MCISRSGNQMMMLILVSLTNSAVCTMDQNVSSITETITVLLWCQKTLKLVHSQFVMIVQGRMFPSHLKAGQCNVMHSTVFCYCVSVWNRKPTLWAQSQVAGLVQYIHLLL